MLFFSFYLWNSFFFSLKPSQDRDREGDGGTEKGMVVLVSLLRYFVLEAFCLWLAYKLKRLACENKNSVNQKKNKQIQLVLLSRKNKIGPMHKVAKIYIAIEKCISTYFTFSSFGLWRASNCSSSSQCVYATRESLDVDCFIIFACTFLLPFCFPLFPFFHRIFFVSFIYSHLFIKFVSFFS